MLNVILITLSSLLSGLRGEAELPCTWISKRIQEWLEDEE
jgi:hypothetical protein